MQKKINIITLKLILHVLRIAPLLENYYLYSHSYGQIRPFLKSMVFYGQNLIYNQF